MTLDDLSYIPFRGFGFGCISSFSRHLLVLRKTWPVSYAGFSNSSRPVKAATASSMVYSYRTVLKLRIALRSIFTRGGFRGKPGQSLLCASYSNLLSRRAFNIRVIPSSGKPAVRQAATAKVIVDA